MSDKGCDRIWYLRSRLTTSSKSLTLKRLLNREARFNIQENASDAHYCIELYHQSVEEFLLSLLHLGKHFQIEAVYPRLYSLGNGLLVSLVDLFHF